MALWVAIVSLAAASPALEVRVQPSEAARKEIADERKSGFARSTYLVDSEALACDRSTPQALRCLDLFLAAAVAPINGVSERSPFADQALAIALRHLGAAHEDTVAARIARAIAAQRTYRSEALWRDALKASRRHLIARHRMTAIAETGLGSAMYDERLMGAVDDGHRKAGIREALSHCRQGLDLHRGLSVDQDPDVIHAVACTGLLLVETAQIAEAIPLQQRAIRYYAAHYPEYAVEYDLLYRSLRSAHLRLGQADALPATSQMNYDLMFRVLGAEDVRTSSARFQLMQDHMLARQWTLAERLLRKIADDETARWGTEAAAAWPLGSLAYVLELQGKLREAEAVHRNIIAILDRTGRPARAARRALADNLFTQGRYEEAQILFVDTAPEIAGEGSLPLETAGLAENLVALGRHKEAEQLYRRILSAKVTDFRCLTDIAYLGVLEGLAKSLEGQQRYTEAVEFWQRADALHGSWVPSLALARLDFAKLGRRRASLKSLRDHWRSMNDPTADYRRAVADLTVQAAWAAYKAGASDDTAPVSVETYDDLGKEEQRACSSLATGG